MKAKLIKDHTDYHLVNDEQFIIGTTDESMLSCTDKQKLSLKKCQAIEGGYDLDELAEEFAKNHSIYPTAQDDTEYGFKAGFQKALELMSDKKFSEEDLINFSEFVSRTYINQYKFLRDKSLEGFFTTNKILTEYQSLQQTEWDVEIEMEYHPTFQIVKLDENGCLILKSL